MTTGRTSVQGTPGFDVTLGRGLLLEIPQQLGVVGRRGSPAPSRAGRVGAGTGLHSADW
ncbi:hypothetical protein [Streptomyces himalayensis]|uniref:Uncharacterized protein n=1 Tax=Streptomyces himalayensis subsp. himalayensis TaxID=2756131 RepID=A0A7W0ICV6_9ACTN|nr:hypothetical protein [Streptomyces himalayensis]MBA2950958.1 hypothetical protein [Streptomyces himalayensis subsp. himalayensis]